MKQKRNILSSGILILLTLVITLSGCREVSLPKARIVQNYHPRNAVIAHRGTIYWAPELTEPAFRWARNAGTDYLELDVQRSADGVLIIMHDRTFKRTTDVGLKFPGREADSVSSFTFEEILQLDAGSPFNIKNPDQARGSFAGEGILVFEDVFRIAEGKKIKRNPDGSRIFHRDETGRYTFEYEADPADNGHRPGVYIELKSPDSYPGIEEEVYTSLALMGWNPLEGAELKEDVPFFVKGKVNVGNTRGKILVQSFSRESMKRLQKIFREEVPASFLIKSDKVTNLSDTLVMDEIISFTISAGAQFLGTNLGEANDGLTPLFARKIHDSGLRVNIYSINTVEQMEKYFIPGGDEGTAPLADGMITNRADLTIDFYNKQKARRYNMSDAPVDILKKLGYN